MPVITAFVPFWCAHDHPAFQFDNEFSFGAVERAHKYAHSHDKGMIKWFDELCIVLINQQFFAYKGKNFDEMCVRAHKENTNDRQIESESEGDFNGNESY